MDSEKNEKMKNKNTVSAPPSAAVFPEKVQSSTSRDEEVS